MLYLILQTLILQGTSRYGNLFEGRGTSTRAKIIMGAIFAALVVLIIIGNAASKRNNPSNGNYSKGRFRKEAMNRGLTKEQANLLIECIGLYQVGRPFEMLSSARILDNTLSKSLRDVGSMEAPQNVKELRRLNLYRIKQRLERFHVQTNRMDSTRQLKLGQKVTMRLENSERFPTVLTGNLKELFCLKIPLNSKGTEIRWKKGRHLDVLLWEKDGEEQVFESKVLGYSSIKGVTSVLLSHTRRITRSYSRRFKRKSIRINCNLYPIRIVLKGVGRRAKRQAVVMNEQRRLVAMKDLSIGGCSFDSGHLFPRGELVKLQFEPTTGKSVVALGKIVDVKKGSRTQYSIHVMFTKASSKNVNYINEYIYDF